MCVCVCIIWRERVRGKEAFTTQPEPARRLTMVPAMSTRSQKTEESCECASESAQRRRYEAVLETAPRTNSMVWIIWCTMT